MAEWWKNFEIDSNFVISLVILDYIVICLQS